MDSKWWAKGLLFENCSCQVICPAHVSFKQLCTYEECIGHWAVHFEEGRFGNVALEGLDAIILYRCPQLMYDGGWSETLMLDERASEAGRGAVEAILTGRAGGPWAVLDRFVETRHPTRLVPIHFEDLGRKKRMWVEGLFETTVENIRGQDRTKEVTIENMFNQVHSSVQVVASGRTWCVDPNHPIDMKGRHALHSRFSWAGE